MNKKNKFGMRLILFIAIIISLSTLLVPKPVGALGVTPAGQLLEYAPNKIVEFSFTIKNSESETKQITITPVGESNNIISLNIQNFTIFAGSTQLVSGTINIPQLNEPGQKIYDIKIEESSPNNVNSNVVAKPGVTYILKINVPYPDKYVDFTVLFTPTNNFNTESIQTSVINRGTLPINEVYAKYDVLYLNKTLKKSIESNKISLEPGIAGKLRTTLENIAPGEYLLKTTVFYDSQKMEKLSQLEFGKKSINVTDIKIEKTSTDGIYKLDITRTLKWNKQIHIKTKAKLVDSENNVISQTELPDTILKPNQNNVQSEFWKIPTSPDGNYTVLITTESENYEQTFQFKSNVKSNQFTIGSKTLKNTDNSWMYYVLAVLILAVITYFIRLTINKKK